jgi:hypothetical protein
VSLRAGLVAALTACSLPPVGGTPYAPELDPGTTASEDSGPPPSDPDPGGESTTADTDVESTGAAEPEPYDGPAFYPAGRVHSPITAFVANGLRDAIALGPLLRDDVFLKAGASSTVSTHALHCFAGDATDLGEQNHLAPTLAYFRGGDAAGTTPFDRATLAAEVGRGAGWCIDGDPSPLDLEVQAIEPRLALVHYGSNDMGFGATYDSAAASFYAGMTTLLDELLAQGIVPILFGITRRADSESAQRWVATYNAIIRGLAQSRQVPFVDAFEAIDPLPGHGLSSDGLHLEAFAGGACVLTDDGLSHGYNVRNLIALEALDRMVAVLVDDAPELDPPEPPPPGDGTAELPYPVHALPFADARDTTHGTAIIDAYPSCSDADESGPELWYRLELDRATAIRAMVLDLEGVDADLHLLAAGGDPDGCLARGDRMVEATLPPGTWDLVVDTWSAEAPLPGAFLLVVVECDADDSACAW